MTIDALVWMAVKIAAQGEGEAHVSRADNPRRGHVQLGFSGTVCVACSPHLLGMGRAGAVICSAAA